MNLPCVVSGDAGGGVGHQGPSTVPYGGNGAEGGSTAGPPCTTAPLPGSRDPRSPPAGLVYREYIAAVCPGQCARGGQHRSVFPRLDFTQSKLGLI